ncbi:hypothetical protein ACQ4N7_23345 [Nodosilinea sp. AN01ver1]|uniref:hypothetical protein n=1 Tax=Nodosilinea sp. AN01ver1 TaxID=3423362 RepID=UPI003D310B5D
MKNIHALASVILEDISLTSQFSVDSQHSILEPKTASTEERESLESQLFVTPLSEVLVPLLQNSELEAQTLARSFNGPLVLAPANLATGIVVDPQGNIIVQTGFNTTKFNSRGQVIQQVSSQAGLFSAERRFAIDYQTGTTVSLTRNGVLTLVNPSTLQEQVIVDLKNISIDTTRVYDFATGIVANRFGSIIPFQTNFGDIAIRSERGTVDIYITGISIAFPFIMRMRFSQGGGFNAEVIAMSLASGAPTDNNPPSIAVNQQGLVLTTLPTGNTSGTFNVPVFFSTDFSQGRGTIPPTQLGNGLFLSSQGMTTDALGNFYVASNAIGLTGQGFSGAGAILVLDPLLNEFQIFQGSPNFPLNGLEDIATNASGTTIYATQDLSPFTAGNERVIALSSSNPSALGTELIGNNSETDSLIGMSLDEPLIESVLNHQKNDLTPIPIIYQSLQENFYSQSTNDGSLPSDSNQEPLFFYENLSQATISTEAPQANYL